MTRMNPVTKPFSVFAIHDEVRGCLLGRDNDHWVVISPGQFRDVQLFDTSQAALAHVGGRTDLKVKEFVVHVEMGSLRPAVGSHALAEEHARVIVSAIA